VTEPEDDPNRYSPRPADNHAPMRKLMWGGVALFTLGVLGMAAAVMLELGPTAEFGSNVFWGFAILTVGGTVGTGWAKEQVQQDRTAHLFVKPERSHRPQFSDMDGGTPPRRSQI